jgi:TetR/AcrR family transcriptional repressor of nem operon
MRTFWTYGYTGTSIADLVEVTSVLRGSMYHTFGDKRSLSIQTLERYGHMALQHATAFWNEAPPRLSNWRAFLMVIVDLPEAEKQRGSMICHCSVEVVPHDSEIAKVVEKMLNEFKRILIARLEKGVLFLHINRFMEVRLPTFATLHNQVDEAHAEAVSLLPFLRLVSFERSIHHDQYSRCHAICGHPSDLRRVGIP